MGVLISGIGLFVIASVIANLLQIRFRFTYESNPVVFVGLFVGLLTVTALYWQYFPALSVAGVLLILAISYCVIVMLLKGYWQPMQSLYGAASLPSAYHGLIRPRVSGQVVKVAELLLQDTAAWLVVMGLVLVSKTPIVPYVLFTIIVFLVHIPAPRLFGPVYGTYFLLASVALASVVPFLFSFGKIGFSLLYALHLSTYIAMYVLFGILGKYKS